MQLSDFQSQLDAFQSKNIHLELLNTEKSGKEATIYRVRDHKGRILALKIYKNHEIRSFKQNYAYNAGMHIGSRTLRQAVKKKSKLGRDFIQSTWVDREYRLLRKLAAAGVNVPKTYGHSTNSVLMEYIGDGAPAPKLAEVRLDRVTAGTLFRQVIDALHVMVKAGFVHGDLSAFNMLYWHDKLFIIDFPQALDILTNPNAWDMLQRDVANVCRYFAKFCEIDQQAVLAEFDQYRGLMVGQA